MSHPGCFLRLLHDVVCDLMKVILVVTYHVDKMPENKREKSGETLKQIYINTRITYMYLSIYKQDLRLLGEYKNKVMLNYSLNKF